MNKKFGLKEIERRAYLSYHNDGLIDLFIGLFLTCFGISIFLTFSGITFVFVVGLIIPSLGILPFVYVGTKKIITIPRIGNVTFAPARIEKTKKVTLLLNILAVLSLIPGIIVALAFDQNPSWLQFLSDYSMLIIGVVGAAVAGLIAYASEINRFKAYGLLFLVVFPAGYFLKTPFEFHLILIGVTILLTGSIYLFRFLRDNPKPSGDEIE